jgi:hypothetical protein
MTSGVQALDGRFVEVGWGLPWPSSGLPGVLFGSRSFYALRWMTPGIILREVVSRSGFTW